MSYAPSSRNECGPLTSRPADGVRRTHGNEQKTQDIPVPVFAHCGAPRRRSTCGRPSATAMTGHRRQRQKEGSVENDRELPGGPFCPWRAPETDSKSGGRRFCGPTAPSQMSLRQAAVAQSLTDWTHWRWRTSWVQCGSKNEPSIVRVKNEQRGFPNESGGAARI